VVYHVTSHHSKMKELLQEIHGCKLCEPYLEHKARPVLAAAPTSRVAIIGQAPGSVVHKSGIPWDDKSGDRLRQWLGVTKDQFYDTRFFALIPMGFCYPGKGKTGDLAPRAECAPKWHNALFEEMKNLKLIILIGSYAQNKYLAHHRKKTLTETVRSFQEYLPKYIVLPHPSPRNNIWIKKNQWFEKELVPFLQQEIEELSN